MKVIRSEEIYDIIEHEDCYKTDDLYYLKSEADKVIAELNAQKAQAEDDCAYWKMCHRNAENAMHETEEACMYLTKSERHHKYKRCLAMAWWCSAKLGMLVSTWESKIKHYKRWQQRWLEIAEQFKDKEEAK